MSCTLGGGIACATALPARTLAVGAVGSVMMWLGVLFVVVLVGGFALLFLRRWLLDTGSGEGATGWDLRSLREMRDRGEISNDEYEVARARIVDAISRPRPRAPVTPSAAGTLPRSGGELRARPGYDLTGEPLPDFDHAENAGDDEQRPEN